MVKSEGNRCQRNCFNCPICTAPLSVNTIETENGGMPQGSFVLACAYCNWSSLEIGIQFDKPNNITGQLSKLKNGRVPITSQRGGRHIAAGEGSERRQQRAEEGEKLGPEEQFANLKSFYTSQLNDPSLNPLMTPSGDYGYSSPNALARIMSMYTGLGNYGKKAKAKSTVMREAYGTEEGVKILDPSEDADAILKMKQLGWDGMTSVAQRSAQTHPSRFLDNVRPVATLLRTKRSKRCRTCRHILVKPESKIQSTRFRIRLVALNYVPSMTLKPLQPASTNLEALRPLTTMQLLLTLSNPLFDPVRITLATPSYTPGRFQSKVTILCPQFDIGANTDVWDEALSGGSRSERSRRTTNDSSEGEKQAEAGKVWDKGRNWTTVVLEIATSSLHSLSKGPSTVGANDTPEELEEDEDVLEIPMFVRIEYETEPTGDEGGNVDKGRKEKRELAYWGVVGVGRIV
ncbi:MAG: hypothetical protein M1830_007070 [Pleopsidium flavum]|nr:MAG: hypothetical protein M1830_007070 [Pleopsidium flavum]